MAIHHFPVPERYSMAALTAALIIGLCLCYLIFAPFIPALVWSLTLTLLFAPLERLLSRWIRLQSISITLTIILAAGMLVVPAVLVSRALINELIGSSGLIGAMLSQDQWQDLAHKQPWLSPIIDWTTARVDPERIIQSLADRLTEWSANVLQGSVTTIINLLLTFYFLFYFLRDRARILGALARMLPLAESEFNRLVDRVARTIFASVYGTLAVAALQGLLAGLMFWALGLPSPVFWGVVMGLLAVVPFLGAFVVWVPFSIGLALDGQWISAVVLALWGTIVVGLVDNVVYPILVGRQLAMHSVLSFIAIVGGLALFGGHGIVLGPLIVVISLTVMDIWRTRMDREYDGSPDSAA